MCTEIVQISHKKDNIYGEDGEVKPTSKSLIAM